MDFSVDLQRFFFAKVSRKFRESSGERESVYGSQWPVSSPHSTFAATSQGNVVNNETLLLLFPGGIFPTWPCIYPCGCFPDRSHSTVCMLFECASTAQKWIAATPRKIYIGFAKVFFIRVEWPIADKGSQINRYLNIVCKYN